MDSVSKIQLLRPPRANAPMGAVPLDEEALRGLRVLIGGPEVGIEGRWGVNEPGVEAKLQGFLEYASFARVDVRRQVLAIDQTSTGPRILATCLWVPAPGRTAMLFGPNMSDHPRAAPALQLAVEAAMEDARAAGVLLVQAMLEPADAAGKTVFAAAGLTQLATLVYMERPPPTNPPDYVLPAGYTLEPYSAATHPLFRQAINRSYEQTLDCPALTGLRDIEDVIEGHKAVGPFDPQLWSVVLESAQRHPVGCVLLSEIPARRALELVYLGLVPEARGCGMARALMLRTLGIASRRAFEIATLAVDAANAPAIRLYRRCGYTRIANRVALIKRLG